MWSCLQPYQSVSGFTVLLLLQVLSLIEPDAHPHGGLRPEIWTCFCFFSPELPQSDPLGSRTVPPADSLPSPPTSSSASSLPPFEPRGSLSLSLSLATIIISYLTAIVNITTVVIQLGSRRTIGKQISRIQSSENNFEICHESREPSEVENWT